MVRSNQTTGVKTILQVLFKIFLNSKNEISIMVYEICFCLKLDVSEILNRNPGNTTHAFNSQINKKLISKIMLLPLV